MERDASTLDGGGRTFGNGRLSRDALGGTGVQHFATRRYLSLRTRKVRTYWRFCLRLSREQTRCNQSVLATQRIYLLAAANHSLNVS